MEIFFCKLNIDANKKMYMSEKKTRNNRGNDNGFCVFFYNFNIAICMFDFSLSYAPAFKIL